MEPYVYAALISLAGFITSAGDPLMQSQCSPVLSQ